MIIKPAVSKSVKRDFMHDVIVSTELECLTTTLGSADRRPAYGKFLDNLSKQSPSLPCSSGIFNFFGRVYIDCGHVEVAASECASPYDLPLILECQQDLMRLAIAQLQQEGTRLLLANNNHSGLLTDDCPTWGAHENYLTEVHPVELRELMLPFLVTRIYGGAGGIEFPSGAFLAAARPKRMELATGGGTTECRAIHSTAREEHHMGCNPSRFRYHLILGDGHRSHFNVALQFAATALAIKAVIYDRQLADDVAKLKRKLQRPSWVATLRRLNRLAEPGRPVKVDPLVIDTQRIYLAAAARYADQLKNPPEWMARALIDWEQTLDAYERNDLPWLAARLDSFTKYLFFSSVLEEQGKSWRQLPGDDILFHELALLDQSYHAFSDPNSVFDRLVEIEAVDHRVGPPLAADHEEEKDRFVPKLGTRADVRAEFIRDHQGESQYCVDWSHIMDFKDNRVFKLEHPFATKLEPSDEIGGAPSSLRRLRDLF